MRDIISFEWLFIIFSILLRKIPFFVKFVLNPMRHHTTPAFFPYICSVKSRWTDERSKSRDPSLGYTLQVGGRAEGWKPTIGQRRARHIYIKGVTVRFGFDVSESRTFNTSCQKQSNQNASWVYYIHSSLTLVNSNVDVGVLYIHIRGAFSVARFDKKGNARA